MVFCTGVFILIHRLHHIQRLIDLFGSVMVMTLCAAAYDWFRQILDCHLAIPATGPSKVRIKGVLGDDDETNSGHHTIVVSGTARRESILTSTATYCVDSLVAVDFLGICIHVLWFSKIRYPLLMVFAEDDNNCDSFITFKGASKSLS